MTEKRFYIYILTNRRNTVLYTGVTNKLDRRIAEHKETTGENSFTARYNLEKLVYFEETGDIKDAIEREKQIKGWLRRRKNELIESMNPEWKDLFEI